MAKRCPESGEMKLYLDCLECENRHRCGDVAKRSEAKEAERKTRNEKGDRQTL